MDKRGGADYLEWKSTWIKVYVMVLYRVILTPALSMGTCIEKLLDMSD